MTRCARRSEFDVDVRATALTQTSNVERQRRKESAMRRLRQQGLRHARGVSIAAALTKRRRRVRDAGFKRWDVHSPFPIHGMDDAMGLGKSWLSAPVLIGGSTGLLTAMLLTLRPVVVHLSARRARQAVRLAHGAGVLPDHVRADGALLRVHRLLRDADHERAAALVSSGLQLEPLQPRDERRILPRRSKRAIRVSPKAKRGSCSRKAAASTSP